MTPFTLPDSTKPQGLSSAPKVETFAVGDLLPGLADIPYIKGDFLVGNAETGRLAQACCTFWSPDTEDRAVIAAGGAIQVLTFAPRPAVQQMSAAFFDDSVPEYPLLVAIARYMYENVHRGSSWENATPEAKENWSKLANGAYRVFDHWHKRIHGK